MMNKAVFIDRDGVINNDEGHYYIFRPGDFRLNQGLVEGLKLLQDAGFKLIVVTNQGGVAKGVYTLEEMHAVHDYFRALMKAEGIEITAIYFCPHHDQVIDCDCRKPRPGMILQGLLDHDIDPGQSYLIGDAERDTEAGRRAGLKQCFRIETNSSILPVCQTIIQL